MAAGLVLAGLPLVVSHPGVVSLVHAGVLLGLGALLPERPWRTGALVAMPGVVTGLLRAAVDGSVVPFAVLALAAPVVVAVSGLIVRVGAALVDRRDQDPGSGQVMPDRDGRRQRPFETRAQRARFLVLLVALFMVGSSLLTSWGAEEADEAARRREREIRSALEGRTAEEVRIQWFTSAYGDTPGLPGGPSRWASLGMDVFQASVRGAAGVALPVPPCTPRRRRSRRGRDSKEPMRRLTPVHSRATRMSTRTRATNANSRTPTMVLRHRYTTATLEAGAWRRSRVRRRADLIGAAG